MALSQNCSNSATIRIFLAASIILNSKANQPTRIRCLEDLFRPVSRDRQATRSTFKPIKKRCTESPRVNLFRNDEIETESIEFAQITEQICCRLAQILFFAESANGGKFQAVAVSIPRMPGQ